MHARSWYLLRKAIKKKRKKFQDSWNLLRFDAKVREVEWENWRNEKKWHGFRGIVRKNHATGIHAGMFVSICHHSGNACEGLLRCSADLEDNFPDYNWEQSEWRWKRSAAKHERATRNPVSEVGRHAGTAASCWRQLSALISFHFLALERAKGRREEVSKQKDSIESLFPSSCSKGIRDVRFENFKGRKGRDGILAMEVDRCRVDGTKFRESSRTTYRRTYVLVEASNRKYPITRIIIRIIDECIVNRSLSCVYIDLNTHLSRICLIFDYFRLITLIVSSLLTWILGLFSFFFYTIYYR